MCAVRPVLQVFYTLSKRDGPLPRYWGSGDRAHKLKSSCITFAGWGVDREIAAEVFEALRPLGVQAALDALELALQKARYEASCIERQYQATEEPGRLVVRLPGSFPLAAPPSFHAVKASPFFRSTFCSIVLSSVSSATSCFSRRFSSCNCAI